MIICHIWDADYPWDVRVEKVCRSLQAKHEVHLICRNEKRSPRHEVLDGTIIHRLPSLPKWLGPCHKIAGLPFFFNPTWLGAIWSTVKRSRADLILVRDIPLARSLVQFDIGEEVPEELYQAAAALLKLALEKKDRLAEEIR